ncbi:MAG TPA: hypothetical protein VK002_13155 [Rubricoccaceae bacterium]|jgi:hypothetical protein|nr:hypothetical protein [Rubricoccaceae bacterium]
MTAIFHSVFHPGEVPFGLVLARAQAQPVALALLGVFVAATVAVLQGEYVLDTLLWAAPITYAAAVAWTIYDLHRRPAAVVLRGGFGAVLSVWDVARARDGKPEAIRFQPVFRPFRKDGQFHVGIGDAVHTLRPEVWPQHAELLDALRAASEELASATA